MKEFDVIVIGAGPGGYVAAIRAAQLGKTVAIIEKEYWGGVCLNVGCIPSKSLLKNAEVAHTLQHRSRDFGFSFDNLTLDYGSAVKRSRKVSSRLVKGVKFLMKKNKIEVHEGTARFQTKDTLTIEKADGTAEDITGKDIIIATGAKVIDIPGFEIDGEKVVTYKEAILQEKLPKSAAIVGAGAIGLEFSTIWSSYGVEVSLIEMLPRIAPNEDAEVSAVLTKEMKKNKINVLAGTRVEKLDASGDLVKLELSNDGETSTLEVDQVLMAVGFTPNTADLGLEAVGVRLSDRGAVEIDDRMQTNVPGIWAVGDATAKMMLAHVGSAQGMLCAEAIAGKETTPLDYEMMPRATYSHPQVASFGITEEQALERGHEVKVGKFNFQANGKALGLNDYAGWVKIISDAKYGELLGAHMVGPEVTELLPELTLAQMNELTAAEIGRNIHAHPSLSEVLMEAAHAVEGHAIHG